MDFQYEKFRDVYEFDRAINSRKNNSVMAGSESSRRAGSWGGTDTYEQADELLQNGWSLKVDEMKRELASYSRKLERATPRLRPSVVGQAPIVANAIRGVPKAMWRSEKIPNKTRTLHIVFNNDASASVSADDLMRSGLTMLKLVKKIESHGIKVKIDVVPYLGRNGDSVYGCGFTIKDYRQPFNLQKMAYPIAHVSVFRRHGFKWLETTGKCTNKGFLHGYGGAVNGEILQSYLKQMKIIGEDSVFVKYEDCERAGFDVDTLEKNILK